MRPKLGDGFKGNAKLAPSNNRSTASHAGADDERRRPNIAEPFASASASPDSYATRGFHSILFPTPDETDTRETHEPPAFFKDLNLDQIVDTMTAEWKDYDIAPFFYAQLNDLDAIMYRQEIVRDLENKSAMQTVQSFSSQMRTMRHRLDQMKKLDDYKYSRERCFLGAVEVYCDAVEYLWEKLRAFNAESRGLLAFREYLTGYVASVPFRNLSTEAQKLKSDLSAIRYCLHIKDGAVTVRHYEGRGPSN